MEEEIFTVFNGENEEKIILKLLHKIIFENDESTAKRIANRIGIPYKTLSRMVSENSLKAGEPKFPLIKLPALAEEVDIEELMEVLCAICGYNISPLKGINENIQINEVNLTNLLKQNSIMMKNVSNLTEKFLKALEDGALTEEEKKELFIEIRKLEKSLKTLGLYIEFFNL